MPTAIKSFRNVRAIALAKGTAPTGFDGLLVTGAPPAEYHDPATAALPPAAMAVRAPDPQPVPFALK